MDGEPAIPRCLRCIGTELVPLLGTTEEATFLECPLCHRQYAGRAGAPLSYRWGHPISLALYGLSFRSGPSDRHLEMAVDALSRGRAPEEVEQAIREIELELAEPTQAVRNILDSPQTESECRDFLATVVASLRSTRP